MILTFFIALLGLAFSRLLFYKFPYLPEDAGIVKKRTLSVIIPARNEAEKLPLLLDDLKKQTAYVDEIICIDDESTDDTAKIAQTFGVKLISVRGKPEDWTGKSWACQTGADAATGELFLFLDADVRLSENALSKLLSAQITSGATVSVQPYHRITEALEHFSMFFNLIQVTANGLTSVFRDKCIGLFGPVILISKEDYQAVGGHRSVRNSITEDVDLGKALKASGKSFSLFLGGGDISFRMYDSIEALIQGWAKNIGTGAASTSFLIVLMIFFWITSCTSAVLYMLLSLFSLELTNFILFAFMYLFWIAELCRIVPRVGNFSKIAIIFYPIPLLVFLFIFFFSLINKLLHRKVLWKGRRIG
jgi:4,4'-diaponeurosporenoate glycosyltransferase